MGFIETRAPARTKQLVFEDYDDRKNTSLFVSLDLWRRFKVWCTQHGYNRSKAVEALIREAMQRDGV